MSFFVNILVFLYLLMIVSRDLYSYNSTQDNFYQTIRSIIFIILIIAVVGILGFYSERKKKAKEKDDAVSKIILSVIDLLKKNKKVFLKDVIVEYKIPKKDAEKIFDEIVKEYGFNLEVDENGDLFIKL